MGSSVYLYKSGNISKENIELYRRRNCVDQNHKNHFRTLNGCAELNVREKENEACCSQDDKVQSCPYLGSQLGGDFEADFFPEKKHWYGKQLSNIPDENQKKIEQRNCS